MHSFVEFAEALLVMEPIEWRRSSYVGDLVELYQEELFGGRMAECVTDEAMKACAPISEFSHYKCPAIF